MRRENEATIGCAVTDSTRSSDRIASQLSVCRRFSSPLPLFSGSVNSHLRRPSSSTPAAVKQADKSNRRHDRHALLAL